MLNPRKYITKLPRSSLIFRLIQLLYHFDWYLKKFLKIGFVDSEKISDKLVLLPSIRLEINTSSKEECDVEQFSYYHQKFELDEVFIYHKLNATISGANSTPRGNGGEFYMTAFEKSYAVLEKSYLYERRNVSQPRESVVNEAFILNRVYNNGVNVNYFHWIIDSVIPAWHTLRNTTVSDEFVLILPPQISSWQQDLLRVAGLEDYDFMNWDSLTTTVKKLHFHSSIRTRTKSFDLLNPVIVKEFATTIKEKLNISEKSRKIFISRQNAYGRRIENWMEFKRILDQFDFEILELEELRIEDQIKAFAEAEVVIGAHGAGLTNLIFADKVKVLELFGEPPMHFSEYYKLCKTMEHSYHFIFTEWSSVNYPATIKKNRYQEHDLVIDVNKFEATLNEILST